MKLPLNTIMNTHGINGRPRFASQDLPKSDVYKVVSLERSARFMNHQEKQLLVLAHALAYQEHEIQYLKALLIEKTNMSIDEYQQEQDAFWNKSKHYRIHATLQTLLGFQEEVGAIREDIDLDMYMDHLRWPQDPPQSPQ